MAHSSLAAVFMLFYGAYLYVIVRVGNSLLWENNGGETDD